MCKINIDVFAENVAKSLKNYLPEEYKESIISVVKVNKNNGLVLTGLNIRNSNCNVSPTIYLDRLFELYEDDIFSIDEVSKKVSEIYLENEAKECIDLDWLSDFDNARDKVVIRLVNAQMNKGFLQGCPTRQLEDLLISYYVKVSDPSLGEGYILIKEPMMKAWEIDEDELYRAALENQHRDGVVIEHIYTVLEKMVPEEQADAFEDMMGEVDVPMYAISNKDKTYGASCILDKEAMESLTGKVGKDFILIPCSVHEFIAIPRGDADMTSLAMIVNEINTTQLGRDIVLSDSVYEYRNSQIHRIAGPESIANEEVC